MTAQDRASRGGTSRYERSARFWLRAYPRRWRDLHGEEALAVLLDLAGPTVPPAPGSDHARSPRWVGVREAVGLVRAGWGLRWREHPPLGRWLLYRLFDARLPATYWWWVADDLHGALYPWRSKLFNIVVVLAAWYGAPLVGWALHGEWDPIFPPWVALVIVGVFTGAGFLWRRQYVERAWRKHVLEGNIPVDPPRAVDA